ncbi:MAG: hypothetical protein ACP5PW_09435, partial [Candidatus Dormibacteria bacterium]
QLLADMEPEELVRAVDFRYLTDVLTPEDALSLLSARRGPSSVPVKWPSRYQNAPGRSTKAAGSRCGRA